MAKEHKFQVGFVFDERCMAHQQDPGHPESPERVMVIRKALEKEGLLAKMLPIAAREATEEELRLVHVQSYIDKVKRVCAGAPDVLGPDVFIMTPDSLLAALLAAGGGFAALDAVQEGKIQRAFCDTRPPGHHALPGQAMGFCIFNNIALAARYAQKKHGLKKILIVDWDVHHGNGTQDIFYEDADVMYFSSHHYPFYPGSGSTLEKGIGDAKGTTLNLPLEGGSGDADYIEGFEELLLPAAMDFKPEMVLVSCGFDSHFRDPLGGMGVTEAGFACLTELIVKIANQTCSGKIVSFLEGGYDLQAIASSALVHVQRLMD
ncbi:MAG: putative Deacetylase, histone deacetylase family [Acidobacteria bacterium]|nr:putative Deacetylase, histone deacetylase family [Acidobacteriota bacterium]